MGTSSPDSTGQPFAAIERVGSAKTCARATTVGLAFRGLIAALAWCVGASVQL